MEKRLVLAVFGIAIAIATAAGAVECRSDTVAESRFTICSVDASRETLRVFYADAAGTRYGSFARLAAALGRDGHRLVFAMNAGMFHPDFRPVGLLIAESREIAPLNRSQGSGNFYLQPNGVLLIDPGAARVLSTDEYRNLTPAFATQSGPMLLHRGQIPAIAAFRSTSRHVRNGVCVPHDATVVFVISENAVTFREFAQYFSAVLKCSEALYLDGSISSLYSRDLERADHGSELGPIVGVLE
jgi:uncharacterized protein YigE (DUF2233 family)